MINSAKMMIDTMLVQQQPSSCSSMLRLMLGSTRQCGKMARGVNRAEPAGGKVERGGAPIAQFSHFSRPWRRPTPLWATTQQR